MITAGINPGITEPFKSLHIDRKNKIVVPFLFKPRIHPNGTAKAFEKYPEILSRLICATPRAFVEFCMDEVVLGTMSNHLIKTGKIDILAPKGNGFNIVCPGKNNEYFALSKNGESLDNLLKEFFNLSESVNPIIRDGIETVKRAMDRNNDEEVRKIIDANPEVKNLFLIIERVRYKIIAANIKPLIFDITLELEIDGRENVSGIKIVLYTVEGKLKINKEDFFNLLSQAELLID